MVKSETRVSTVQLLIFYTEIW